MKRPKTLMTTSCTIIVACLLSLCCRGNTSLVYRILLSMLYSTAYRFLCPYSTRLLRNMAETFPKSVIQCRKIPKISEKNFEKYICVLCKMPFHIQVRRVCQKKFKGKATF